MKKVVNNKYFKYGLTAFIVLASGILLYFLLNKISVLFNILKAILIMLKPLIYGICIAFLLTQLYNYFERVFNKLLHKNIKDKKKCEKYSKIISIILSILIMILVLFFFIYIIIPKLITSVLGIIENWDIDIENVELWLKNVLPLSPKLEASILSMVNSSSSSLLQWLSTSLVPNLENITNSVTTGLNDMYVFIKDFIIGLVFSIYILANKNKFIAGSKKVTYRLFGIKKGNNIMESSRYTYKVLVGFIKGKLITSLIIGTGCYLGMIILHLPYALLVSVIVAITNIIPFFGPIIGWVPSVIIIALVSPLEALYFTIMIVILQQIEGNILEPKIVGNITGISAFWVLFSIIIFGDLFGIVGMIIGVPIFAVIYHFVCNKIDKNLKKKGLPTDIEDYSNLKYIDEDTKEIIK